MMSYKKQPCLLGCILAIIFLLPISTNGANILGLFPHRGKSHFDFFRPIFLELAKSGHKVDVVSFFPNAKPVENYTDYTIGGVELYTEFIDLQLFENQLEIDAFPFKVLTFFMLHDWGLENCILTFEHEQMKRILKSNKKYDLIIMEQFNNDCMLGVAHKFNAPIVALSSCALMPWHYKRMGSPMILSHMPMNFLPFTENMGFLDRFINFLHFHSINAFYDYFTQPATNKILKKYFGPGVPKVEKLVKQTSVMLVNQHYSLSGAFPFSPNIIEVGGLQIQQEKPLDKELQTILDNSPQKGVIYISWGSMVRPETMSTTKLDALLAVIKEFSDYLFIMKWPENSKINKPSNLFTRSWLRQREILCHSKIRAFFTHGGLLGTSEAIYCGVPMIVTPFYGDQPLNSVSIENRKLGIVVKFKNFNQQNLASALNRILSPSFQNNVRQVSEVYKNRPIKPLDLSIWWIEHVIATKGAPLAQSSSIEMNKFVYNSIDVYIFLAFIILVLILFLFILLKVISRILRGLMGKSKQKLS